MNVLDPKPIPPPKLLTQEEKDDMVNHRIPGWYDLDRNTLMWHYEPAEEDE